MSHSFKIEILSLSDQNPDLTFKIIVIGEAGVGKSSLALKAIKNEYNERYLPTIGFENLTFNLKINDKIIKLQVWDTCGQETYRSLIKNYYRNSSLVILVYSIDDRNSFINLKEWLNEIKTNTTTELRIFLVGNKIDVDDNKTIIDKETAFKFYKENKLDFFIETSAKTGYNAQNVFIQAAKMLYEDYLENKGVYIAENNDCNKIDENIQKILIEKKGTQQICYNNCC